MRRATCSANVRAARHAAAKARPCSIRGGPTPTPAFSRFQPKPSQHVDWRPITKMLTKDEARRIAANVAKLPERSRSRKRELALEYVLGCPLPGRAAGKGVLETLSITPWETPASHSHDRTRPTEFRAADLTSEGKTSSRHNLHSGFTQVPSTLRQDKNFDDSWTLQKKHTTAAPSNLSTAIELRRHEVEC
jgi:hypothetical protein